MKSKPVFWVIIAVLIVIGLSLFIKQVKQGMQEQTQPSPVSEIVLLTPSPSASREARLKRELTVTLATQNKSTESGTAKLTEINGKTKVELSLTGAPKKLGQPAHIHAGVCPGVGEVKYPLTTVLDGKSETTIELNLDELLTKLPLAINVHKSAAEPKIYVSCGKITSP